MAYIWNAVPFWETEAEELLRIRGQAKRTSNRKWASRGRAQEITITYFLGFQLWLSDMASIYSIYTKHKFITQIMVTFMLLD